MFHFIAEGERRLPARVRWRRRRRRQPTGGAPTTVPRSSVAGEPLPLPSVAISGTTPPHPTPRRPPMSKGKHICYCIALTLPDWMEVYITKTNCTRAGRRLIIDGTQAGTGSEARQAARARRVHRVEAPRAAAGGGGGARARARRDRTPVRRSPATARAPPRHAPGNWRVRRPRRSLPTPRPTTTTTRYLYLFKLLGHLTCFQFVFKCTYYILPSRFLQLTTSIQRLAVVVDGKRPTVGHLRPESAHSFDRQLPERRALSRV